MAKTITIPKRFGYPTVDIEVNNKKYTYPTGVEVEVDDVAAESIENAIALEPKEDPNAGKGGGDMNIRSLTFTEPGTYDIPNTKVFKDKVRWREHLDLEAILAVLTEENLESLSNGDDVTLFDDEYLCTQSGNSYILAFEAETDRAVCYDFTGGLVGRIGWFDFTEYDENRKLVPISAPMWSIPFEGIDKEEFHYGNIPFDMAGELFFTESMFERVDATNHVIVDDMVQRFVEIRGGEYLFGYVDGWAVERLAGRIDYTFMASLDCMFISSSARIIPPLKGTRYATTMRSMFSYCHRLHTVSDLDVRGATSLDNLFMSCESLENVLLRNIKASLAVGSGTSYGHLLTVESLIRLIYELRDMGKSRTLTVGSANLEKLTDVYVRTIDITDEMREEDDLIDNKLPFVVCESTDEGAVLITDYVGFKNWQLA